MDFYKVYVFLDITKRLPERSLFLLFVDDCKNYSTVTLALVSTDSSSVSAAGVSVVSSIIASGAAGSSVIASSSEPKQAVSERPSIRTRRSEVSFFMIKWLRNEIGLIKRLI